MRDYSIRSWVERREQDAAAQHSSAMCARLVPVMSSRPGATVHLLCELAVMS